MEVNIQTHIREIKDLEESKIIHLMCDSDGQVVEFQASIRFFKYLNPFTGKGEFLGIFLLYDLKSGLFWYSYYPEYSQNSSIEKNIESDLNKMGYFKNNQMTYINHINQNLTYGPARLTYFSVEEIVQVFLTGFYATLLVRTSKKLYDTFEKAYKSLMKIIRKKIILGDSHFINEFENKISLRNLSSSFFGGSRSAYKSTRAADIIKLERVNAKWYLELEGVNNQRTTVVLSDDFELLKVFGKSFIKKK